MCWVFKCFSAVALVIVTAGAVAAQQSGTAIRVKQAADVGRGGGQLMLREQAPVFMGDVIKTGPVGEAQIRLSDDTRLVVGPNSLMTIDRFVFASTNTASQVSLNAVRGAFRFITGGSRKEAYAISTPTATIGLRGTRLDFSVGDWGTTLAVFGDGSADLCERDRRNRCERSITACGVAAAAPRQDIRRIEELDERITTLVSLFPFVIDQRRLNPDFQVDIDDCGIPDAVLRAARRAGPRLPDDDDDDGPETTASVTPPPDDEECNVLPGC